LKRRVTAVKKRSPAEFSVQGGRRLTRGVHMSASGRERAVPVWGFFSFLGCGLDPLLGQNGAPGPYLVFISFSSFSFSVFLISFIDFAY
jgi:hypothetical protein